MAAIDEYKEFNEFQTAFFTDIDKFSRYSDYEVRRHSYKLFETISKQYPALVCAVQNLQGFEWKASESKEILQALQRKFVTRLKRYQGVPQFVFYKSAEREKKTKVKETKFGLIFDTDIRSRIMQIKMYDNKTYEHLKFTEEIQQLGKQFLGVFDSEKLKAKSTTNKAKTTKAKTIKILK